MGVPLPVTRMSTSRLATLRTSAQLAILHGDVDAARGLLSTVVTEAEPAGELHDLRLALQLEGLLELSLGNATAALRPLQAAREIAERMAIAEPSMLTFMLDEVEAHASVGDAASATAVLMAFDRRCDGDRSPWVVPLALRARALVEASIGDLVTARATLEAAVAAEGDLPLPFERARTRLAVGRVLFRLEQHSRAKEELGEALARFEELGASLWAARAREELGRIDAVPSDDPAPANRGGPRRRCD